MTGEVSDFLDQLSINSGVTTAETMGLFDDFSQFFETRLDEFLKSNPHLELEAILDQLREQERDTLKLIRTLETQLESQILNLAQEIKNWHGRIEKAKAASRHDLAQAAQEREAALLRQGNQVWGQMEGTKQRISQAQILLSQIQPKIKEVQAQAQQARSAQSANNWDTIGWNQGSTPPPYNKATDPLESEFQRWELDEELNRIKRDL
jgi:uncharacterized protein (TIGR04376 family)